MTLPIRCLAAATAALLLAGPGWSQESGAAAPQAAGSKSILWSKTWEAALFEAKTRNVPIFILVSIGEG